MPCWVVPSVVAELWNVPLEQIMSAVHSGQLRSKQENGFTFIDVAPTAHNAMPARPVERPRPITYKVVRPSGPPESYKIPRPAEVITPAELESLTGDTTEEARAGAMGDWRRGRRHATDRRNPPDLNAA